MEYMSWVLDVMVEMDDPSQVFMGGELINETIIARGPSVMVFSYGCFGVLMAFDSSLFDFPSPKS
jgi:hypothetical protein